MYQYQEFDQRFIEERVEQYREQTERYLDGELNEDQFLQLRLRNGLYIQRLAPMLPRGDSLWDVVVATVARAGGDLAPLRQGLRSPSAHARISSSTGPNSNPCPTFSPTLPRSRCTPSKPAAVAFATSPPTSSRVLPTTNASTRARTASSFANGRPSIPSSIGCPGNSRSPSRPRNRIGRRSMYTTSAFALTGTLRAMSSSTSWSAAGWERTPAIGSVIRRELPEQHLLTYLEAILRVYNRHGPPRQQVQGSHQDSGPGDDAAGVRRTRGSGVGAANGCPEHPDRSRTRPCKGLFHAAGLSRPRRSNRVACGAKATVPRV